MLAKKFVWTVLMAVAVFAAATLASPEAGSKAVAEPVGERLVTRTMPPSDPGPKKPRWAAPQPFV
jgi:hypothetical protein